MTTPADPSRPAAPTVREIAALTARLREITARGRAVDPAERAQFLADKEALIARITATDTGRAAVRARDEAQDALADTRDDAGLVDEADATGAVVHTFDPADAYTASEIGAIAAAHARGDYGEVARLEAGRPSMAPDRAEVEVEMPEWMREQARVTEAEIAAGTYVPGAPDDRERIADRLTELRTKGEMASRGVGAATDSGTLQFDDPPWWAPAASDDVPLTHREVAEELTGRGFTPEQARAAITEYLDDTSDRIGTSVHQWAMDSHDVEAIAHTRYPPVPVPEQRHASTGDLSPALGAAPPANAGERDECEAGRREQLVRWHTDDTTAGTDRGERADEPLVGPDDDDGEALIFEGRRW